MRILVLGSGAREHALVLSLFHDPAVDDIHVAPGNVGMKPLATLHSEVTRIDDPDTVVALARDIAVDLVVIGPEIPLVAGVADALRSAGFLVFGPIKQLPASRAPRHSPRMSWPRPGCEPPAANS